MISSVMFKNQCRRRNSCRKKIRIIVVVLDHEKKTAFVLVLSLVVGAFWCPILLLMYCVLYFRQLLFGLVLLLC